MRKHGSIFVRAVSILMLSAFIVPMQVDAQLLKKISRGLEKVNKGLEQVGKSIEKVENATGKNKKQKNKPARQENVDTGSSSDIPAEQNMYARRDVSYDWRDKVQRPHLTPRTRFLAKKVNYDNLPVISEGIFYIQEYNRNIGYGSYYGFWTIDGKCLFPAIYEGFTAEPPRFDSGACVVKATGTKRHSPMILYADGTTKSLSHEWEKMTQFHDGVAMVREIVDMRSINLFYINTKGEKIWPHLANSNIKSGIVLEMRPVCEGLRAYYSNPDRAWGFLNCDGSVAIQPQFAEVRDFANGYALVIAKTPAGNKAVFIDRKGTVVTEVPGNISSLQYSYGVSDVCDGYFLVNSDSDTDAAFYNLRGEVIKSYPEASGFADGYAFYLTEKYGDRVMVINPGFDIVGQWPFATTSSEGFRGSQILFRDVPYYTYDRSVTINTAGEPVMYQPAPVFSDNRLGQFSADGYASAQSEFEDPENPGEKIIYTGYIDTEGRYRVVFSESPNAGGPFHSRLPGPEPIEPVKPGEPLPPVDTIPQGPVGGGEKYVRYRVRVSAHPEEGGRVFGSGEYAYGDTIRVTGKPSEGWKISYIESSRPSSATSVFNKFVVKGDMEIDCYFTRKDTVGDVSDIAMEGTLPRMGLPVYLQLGGEGNRYAAPSNGFMAVEFDDYKEYGASDLSGKASLSVNIFFVPMNVLGIQKEGDRQYLRLDGGIMKYSNLGITDNTGTGVFNNPLLSMMMAFDGADQGELQPACYRVEIVGGSLEDGNIRLGLTQRFSPKRGWISADDESFCMPLGGFFIKRVDKGLGSDFLNGVVLKSCGKRDVKWEPGSDFYGGNQTMLEGFASALGEMFRRKVSGTPLSDYDMQQFSTDLDNHLFKMRP